MTAPSVRVSTPAMMAGSSTSVARRSFAVVTAYTNFSVTVSGKSAKITSYVNHVWLCLFFVGLICEKEKKFQDSQIMRTFKKGYQKKKR